MLNLHGINIDKQRVSIGGGLRTAGATLTMRADAGGEVGATKEMSILLLLTTSSPPCYQTPNLSQLRKSSIAFVSGRNASRTTERWPTRHLVLKLNVHSDGAAVPGEII